MQNITGKIAFGGIAIGKIKEISKENNVVRRVKIEDAKAGIVNPNATTIVRQRAESVLQILLFFISGNLLII